VEGAGLVTLTPEEALISLIAFDVAEAMGWDAAPSEAAFASAKEKIEEWAGDQPAPLYVLGDDR